MSKCSISDTMSAPNVSRKPKYRLELEHRWDIRSTVWKFLTRIEKISNNYLVMKYDKIKSNNLSIFFNLLKSKYF